MELRHLRYFVAVAEELSFTRAALRLHVSQPPLSRQIRDLEAEIHAALFLREKRGVKLTAAGQLFLTEAHQILAQSERALQVARTPRLDEAGRLAIAYTAAIFDPALARCLRLFRQRFPLVDLEIREMSAFQQTEALMEKQIDLGYVAIRFPEREQDLVFECLRRAPAWVALPKGHPLARRRRLTFRDLKGEVFVLPRWVEGSSFHAWFSRQCAAAGFTPRLMQKADNAYSVLGLVSAGVGIALMPEMARHLMSTEIEFRPLPASVPKFEFHVVWLRGNPSPFLQAFLRLVRAEWGRGKSASPKKPKPLPAD